MTTTSIWVEQDVNHVWHPYTHIGRHAEQGPVVIVRAKDCHVWDSEGHEYIDGLSGLFTTQVGHGREEIAKAVAAQMLELDHYSLFHGFTNPKAAELATKLAAISPGDLDYAFFACSGSEVNEIAIKLARHYHKLRGQPSRTKVISRNVSYHGTTMGALSATGFSEFRAPYEPVLPGFGKVARCDCSHCPFGLTYGSCQIQCAADLERTILAEGPHNVAAFLAEPITAAGGVAIPPPEYWREVRRICDKYGVLLIADEVLTGFGRTGKLFASQHYDLEPDMMTLSKGISSGYVPLGATMISRRIADTFKEGPEPFQHGQTFGGHPAACAAALANLKILEREGLVENAANVGAYLLSRLREALASLPAVGEISGLGLLLSIEAVVPGSNRQPLDAVSCEAIRQAGLQAGLIFRFSRNFVILAPPLTLTKAVADQIVERMVQAFHVVTAV